MQDVLADFGTAKALDHERCRFAIHGGSYRVIAAFDFGRQVIYLKFIGTHTEYDKVDALTVSLF